MPPSTTMRVWFEEDSEAESVISEAEEKAVTAWEMQFVDGVRRRFDTYGLDSFMTETQAEQLNRIANK
jgi:hypothetical protein